VAKGVAAVQGWERPKETKTAEELAAMIHEDLSKVEGGPTAGVNVTVYGIPWKSMLTFSPAAGPVRNKAELQKFFKIITERHQRLYDIAWAKPSRAFAVGLGLDTRADGGYILGAPSLHPDGPSYRFGNDEALALGPEWLIQRACHKPATPSSIKMITPLITSPTAYGRAALVRECEALASAPCGTRNHAPNRASFSLHQLAPAANSILSPSAMG
jgi:hypothetical protein